MPPNANDNNKIIMMVELKIPPGVTTISREASGGGGRGRVN